MKRFTALLLGVLLLLGCAGCSTDPYTDTLATDPYTGGEDQTPLVQKILDAQNFQETAVPLSVYAPRNRAMSTTGNAASLALGSYSHPLAQLCSGMAVNPISAFRSLVRAGLYSAADTPATFDLPMYYDEWYAMRLDTLGQDVQTMDFSSTASKDVLEAILKQSSGNTDHFDLEYMYLGAISEGSSRAVHTAEDCDYAYFICYGNTAAHVLCFYLRGSDVEFQLLSTDFIVIAGAGGAMQCDNVYFSGRWQAASLMCAIEQLLTGTTIFETVEFNEEEPYASIPTEYDLGGYHVTITQEDYISEASWTGEVSDGEEHAHLITYRIRPTGE